MAGGLIPLIPYMIATKVKTALLFSAIVTVIALFGFGYGKNKMIGLSPLRGGFQTILIGGVAAGLSAAASAVRSCARHPPPRRRARSPARSTSAAPATIF